MYLEAAKPFLILSGLQAKAGEVEFSHPVLRKGRVCQGGIRPPIGYLKSSPCPPVAREAIYRLMQDFPGLFQLVSAALAMWGSEKARKIHPRAFNTS